MLEREETKKIRSEEGRKGWSGEIKKVRN